MLTHWETMPINNRLLDNGIRLITEPIDGALVSAIGFWFLTGSIDDPPDALGISHLVEHLMFKGTRSFCGADLSSFFDCTGGYYNASTDHETVCLYGVVPAFAFEKAVEILLSMATEALIRPQDVESEREVVVSEILAALDDPEEQASDSALAAFFPGQLISLPVGGTLATVRSITPEKALSWYQTRFAAGQLLVSVAGYLDEEKLASMLCPPSVPKDRSALRLQRPPAEVRPAGNPRWSSERIHYRAPGHQMQIHAAIPADPAPAQDNWYAWQIVNTILGGTPGSRLFKKLREERALCYTVYSALHRERSGAFWYAYLSVPPRRSEEACLYLLDLLHEFSVLGPTEEEFRNAGTRLIGELIVSFQDADHRMRRIARQWLSGYAVMDQFQISDVIRGVDPLLVHQLAASLSDTASLALAFHGPALPASTRRRLCLKHKKYKPLQ